MHRRHQGLLRPIKRPAMSETRWITRGRRTPGVDDALAAPQWRHENPATAAQGHVGDGSPMLLTPREVEDALKLGRTKTHQLLRSGELPSLRVGRSIRVSRSALEQWIVDRSG